MLHIGLKDWTSASIRHSTTSTHCMGTGNSLEVNSIVGPHHNMKHALPLGFSFESKEMLEPYKDITCLLLLSSRSTAVHPCS